jgi:hypothetical protein
MCCWKLIVIENCYVTKLIIGLHTYEKTIKEMRDKKARGDDDVPENVLKT